MTDPRDQAQPAGDGRRLLKALNPIALTSDLWRHREVISQFTKREIEGRYRGSHLGLLWSFITPLIMLVVYTFVFGVVFKARWPMEHGNDSLANFALVMFAGQIAFQCFAEPLIRAPSLITAVPNFVKKVVFPLQVLAVAVVGAAAFHAFIAVVVLVACSLFFAGTVPWTVILVPAAVLPLLMLGLGVSWFLAALGVYIRDIGFVVGVVLQVLFFMTPIFYPISAIPEAYRHWMMLNPLVPGVALVRACLITGDLPGWPVWGVAFALGLSALSLGYAWFTVTRKGFADVL